MAKRGPKPTPTAILKLRGSTRANSRPCEPNAGSEAPSCPTWLNGEAKRAWRQLVPELKAMGVISKIDKNALARYCWTWALWRKMVKWIDDHNVAYTAKDKEGNQGMKLWPQVRVERDLEAALGRLEASFGLSPSARTRLIVDSQPVKSKDQQSDKHRFFGAS